MFWLVRRVAVSLILLWIVTSLVFLSIHMVPGDPAELLLSNEGQSANEAAVAEMRQRLGLDKPLHVQYLEKMAALARGDLGRSIVDGSSISDQLARRLPRTLELVAMASLLSILIGVPAGVFAALRRGGGFDRIGSAVTGITQSVPVFVKGTVMVLVFAQMLRWVPAGGYVALAEAPLRHLLLLFMPALSIAIGLSGVMFRITRSSTLEIIPQDYVRTARAKGLPRRRIVLRHILRNALMPVLTVFALSVGTLLGGTVLVEYVFNWPGLSGMLVNAVYARDYPIVVAVILVTSALFIFINLVVDVIYAVLDPRVRN